MDVSADTRRRHPGRRHSPGCRIAYFDETLELGELPDDLRDTAHEFGVVHCVDGCPQAAEAIELGRKLAARFGW